MIAYLIKRLLSALPVLFGVVTLTFLLLHFVPGDPVDLMLGDQASIADRESLRRELGLDRPLPAQYASYLRGVLSLDFGRSLHSRRPVFDEIAERVPATVELTFAAIFLALAFGVPLGVVAAVRRGGWLDRGVLFAGLAGMSLPGIWLGPMLILIFAIHLDWFPVSERGGIENLVLPAVSLAFALGAVLMRMTRASMLEVLKEDYVGLARAKGLSPFKIYFKHALANALIPIITVVGLQFGALLTGTVITETIFDWPGIGTLFFRAIRLRDYTLVQGCVLFIALTYVFVNLLTDLAYAWANPKIRLNT